MVHLAGELNEKLTAAASSTSPPTSDPTTPSSSSLALNTTTPHELPEEATFIRSSLSQLGLQMTNVPVTNDMIKDEDKWVSELAKELAGVLKGMMKDRGIVALDEVWGGWNRARGVGKSRSLFISMFTSLFPALHLHIFRNYSLQNLYYATNPLTPNHTALLPPTTFLQVTPHLPQHTSPPIHKRTFKSGLTVLHTPPYSQHAFSDRLTAHLTTDGPKTTMEVAMIEGITVALAKEMINDAEMRGDVVRAGAECVIADGGGVGLGVGEAGVRWWPNVFVGYVWDGQVFDDT